MIKIVHKLEKLTTPKKSIMGQEQKFSNFHTTRLMSWASNLHYFKKYKDEDKENGERKKQESKEKKTENPPITTEDIEKRKS